MARWEREGNGGSWYPRYERAAPRAVKNGIKARSERGRIGETWWSERWIGVLESFDMGARLARGRSYARRGQVASLTVDAGVVRAKVQGSRPKPYDVRIRLEPLPDATWEAVTRAMSEQAIFAARLLAGEMPRDIEEAFREARAPLFPTRQRDLDTACSCPDWANPCKHVAAVYLILAERFDDDPFLLFELRGRNRDALLRELGARRASAPEEPTPVQPASAPARTPRAKRAGPPGAKRKTPVAEPPVDAHRFWTPGEGFEALRWEITPPADPSSVMRRLGPAPFETAEGDVALRLASAYAAASRWAIETATREEDADPAPGAAGRSDVRLP